jgi:dUTP pyrophosphatase
MQANGLKIFYEKTHENAVVPTYAHPGDCCCDLYAVEEVTIKRFERKLLDTGIAIEIPEGFEVQIRPRSGNAYKHGLTVLNAPGTVDSQYRNSLKVLLINLGEDDYTVKAGDRIGQAKFSPVYVGHFIETQKLSDTNRGLGGWGSTGR